METTQISRCLCAFCRCLCADVTECNYNYLYGDNPRVQMPDTIDSRDVIARIEDLERVRGIEDLPRKSINELKALTELAKEAFDYTEDWSDGTTLIRDSYFKAHAQDLAEDIGAISPTDSWPINCIDWDRAARELKMDYTEVYFAGVSYWVRLA